jgi:hypothetical protein
MEAIRSSETLVTAYKTTLRHSPKDCRLQDVQNLELGLHVHMVFENH